MMVIKLLVFIVTRTVAIAKALSESTKKGYNQLKKIDMTFVIIVVLPCTVFLAMFGAILYQLYKESQPVTYEKVREPWVIKGDSLLYNGEVYITTPSKERILVKGSNGELYLVPPGIRVRDIPDCRECVVYPYPETIR